VFDAGEFVRELIMMFRFARRRVVVAALAVAVALLLPAQLGRSAQLQKLRIAAAADLQFAMADLSGQYEKQTGTATDITYGSSGNFFAQIQNGAPFDLFFSADIDYPEKLDAAGLTEPGSLNKYAVGRIVIWVPTESKIDVARQKWDSLLQAGVQKIAVANPQHAPYGRAAEARWNLRPSSIQARLWRKYFASGSIRSIGQRAGGDYRAVAGTVAGDERRQAMGNSCRGLFSNRAGSRHSQEFPEQRRGAKISGVCEK
jgi:molybdenum ABC transporter molybdate-binding protein